MSKELLANFALLAASEGGIAKLRELILSLAVRGKLVPQDPKDEPASELLTQICTKKERLVAVGKIKRDKPLPPIGEDEKPFELPEEWEWARLGSLIELISGQHLGPAEYFEKSTPDSIPYLTGPAEFGERSPLPLRHTDERRAICCKGDILVTVKGSGVGKTNITSQDELAISRQLMAVRPILLDGRYCEKLLESLAQTFQAKSVGIAIPGISRDDVREAIVGIPPLPEQSRIVAKVEALMALCDRLEGQQGEAGRAQAHWTQAALDQLADSADADEFARNWQALAEHFDTLFATPASIDALDATLLQLAVRGKLVPQNPADEPASELLKKIRGEKDRLIAEGKIKRDKPLPPIADDEKPFELPEGWKWARFGHIAEIASNLVAPRDHLNSPQVAPDCIQKGTGKLIAHRTVREAGITSPNHQFYAGQILYSKIRPSLSKAVLIDFSGLCSADMYPVSSKIEPSILLRVILSALFLNQVVQAENRVKMPKLNQEALNAFLVPTPSLPEQSRIVTKLDELFALTRTLRVRLTDARAVQARLASALVDEVAAC